MGVSYFIRTTSKNKKKDVTIRLRLRDGQKINMFAVTPLSIPVKYWNEKAKTSRDKVRDMTEFIERDWYKNQLEGLEKQIKISYQQLKEDPTPEWLKEVIDIYFHPKQKEQEKSVTLFGFIEEYIESSKNRINPKTGKKIADRTIKKYTSCFNHLMQYCQYKKTTIDFKDIDMKFYNSFVKYLNQRLINKGKDDEGNKITETGLAVNTIGKQISTLKGFLNEATELGYNTYNGYNSKNFTVLTENSDAIYLNEQELDILFKLDLSGNQRLDRIRDLFLIGCWTGCRFSDFSAITPDQITNGFLHVRQEKTGAKVVIPLHAVVKSILDKYDGNLPLAPSNQKFNDYIKEVCALASINEETQKTITRGGRRVTATFKKSDLVSSHTARRSFATNLYKNGFPAISIMKITGHTTEKSFLKYIRVTPEEHAKLLAEHWKKLNNKAE